MQTNCLAIVKVVQNKRLDTYRVLITFDKTKRDKYGNVTVTVHNAIYASGDICSIGDSQEYIEASITRTLKNAANTLRTENFEFV